MALRRLKTAEMVSLISSWVDDDHPDRQALRGVALMAALLPTIDAAYEVLIATHGARPSPGRLARIQERQAAVDAVHDDLVRVIYHSLRAAIYDRRARDAHQPLEALQAMLLPEGLRMVQKSYREEAGHVAVVAEQLGDSERALLASLPVSERRSLLDVVEQWIEEGMRLGALDRERSGGDEPRVTPGAIMAARNQWIRAMHIVRTNASLIAAEHPEIAGLIAHIDRAEAEAERRAAGRGDDVGEPASGPDADRDQGPDGEAPSAPSSAPSDPDQVPA
ncbi:hypothetical protein [Haliangium sp.]|uniref:hypothetical protein n=1 Tax=Haliangium sp. TaxID=2663208 RepID=UPI003D12719C